MSIPHQVEEAAQMAEELQGRLTGEANPPGEQPQQDVEDTPKQEPSQEPQEDLHEELRRFKDKYNTLQGKYDAEVPRLHQEIQDFKQRVFDKVLSQAQPEPEQVSPMDQRLAKFREEYGDEMFEAIRMIAKRETEPLVQERLQAVSQSVEQVEETQVTAARNNFMNYLDQSVKGDWKSLWSGNDQKFIDFLSKPDPSGLYTYGDLVQAYNDNWDGDRLAKVFNTYFDEQTPKQQRQVTAPTAMVAPNRTTQHVTPSADEKPIWTQSMIRQFQEDDRRNKYTPEVSKSKWEDLTLALAEGRIRG